MSRRRVEPLAAVYAAALGQVADERGGEALVREVGEALAALGGAWADQRTLRAYFLSAMVKQEEKAQSLDRLLAGLPPLLGDFVRLLLDHGRARLLDRVAVAYEVWTDVRLDRVPVTLNTATPASEEHLRLWTDRLRAALRQEPVLEHHVKPELVAGATLRVGDLVLDLSGRRMLAEIGRRVRGRRQHAVQS